MRPARDTSTDSRRLGVTALLLAALLVAGLVAGCGGGGSSTGGPAGGPYGGGGAETDGSDATDPAGGTRITIAGDEALTWGDGPYGVVLAHGAAFDAASWSGQAPAIADQGATVVAVESIDPAAIADAVAHLQDQGVADVALVGGSAGADAILELASQDPQLPDQLVLLSPNSTVDGLGVQPKLFIASEDEPAADVAAGLAESAPGEQNEALLLPGSAHAQHIFDTDQGQEALEALLRRLDRFADD